MTPWGVSFRGHWEPEWNVFPSSLFARHRGTRTINAGNVFNSQIPSFSPPHKAGWRFTVCSPVSIKTEIWKGVQHGSMPQKHVSLSVCGSDRHEWPSSTPWRGLNWKGLLTGRELPVTGGDQAVSRQLWLEIYVSDRTLDYSASLSPIHHFTVHGFSYLYSSKAWKYQMEIFRNKEFINFTLHVFLGSKITSSTDLLCSSQDMSHHLTRVSTSYIPPTP